MAEFSKELFENSLCIESNKWTKDTLSGLPACKGVLLFINAAGQPIQLLQAANLRRTAMAKLITSDEPASINRKTNISELSSKVCYITCSNNFQTQLSYIHLAHAVFEKTAGDWILLPRPSFMSIDTDRPLPYFYVSDTPQKSEARNAFGLFPNRKAAASFCEILNTVFGLCRNSSFLNTGREVSCPYLQMKTCLGPCIDIALREKYIDSVRQACDTAAGKIQPTIENLRERMSVASQSMQFEKAAVFKKKIDTLQKLTSLDFCWVHNLDDLCILHIDLGQNRKIAGKNKKRRLYKAYKITAKNIYELGVFVPKSTEQIISFLNHTWNRGQPLPYTLKPKEHLATLSLFLFRSARSGIWLDCTETIPKEVLIKQLQKAFDIKFHDKSTELS